MHSTLTKIFCKKMKIIEIGLANFSKMWYALIKNKQSMKVDLQPAATIAKVKRKGLRKNHKILSEVIIYASVLSSPSGS